MTYLADILRSKRRLATRFQQDGLREVSGCFVRTLQMLPQILYVEEGVCTFVDQESLIPLIVNIGSGANSSRRRDG